MTTYRDEIEALITTFFYKYYKDYVEPLELEHDELLKQNKCLQSKLTRIQNKNKELTKTKVTSYEGSEYKRIRKLCEKLQKDNERLKNQIRNINKI